MNREEKPVVTFGDILGWSDRGRYGITAVLLEVRDHPYLGSQAEVRTSQVIGIRYDDDRRVVEIETLNTVYKYKP